MPRFLHRLRLGAAGWLAAGLFCRLSAASPELTPETMPRVPASEPADAVRTFDVRPGFHAELIAAEPLINSPVAVTVDETGAAFVVEMRDYSERRPERLGRIRRLTDADGDGRYDRATVYLDNLPWPTAVTCWDGGVFLGATPDLIYAKDIDGDGVADVREVVFTGFANRSAPFATNQLNVQALLNSLQWGLDQRIHGATSMSGGEVQRNDSPFTRAWRERFGEGSPNRSGKNIATAVSLNGLDFSFDPRSLELRAEPGGGQHGMSFDDAGRKFVCSNSDHLQWIAFNDLNAPSNPYHDLPPSRRSIAADGAAAEVFRRSPDEPWRVLRTKWRVAGVVEGLIEGGGRPSGYFTGASGVTIYRGDAYGPDFAGDAFIADCGSNLIHRKKLRHAPDDSGLIGERAPDETQREFLASTDNWFRPVQFYNAPDGCLWVVDMYRETIEHPWSIPPRLKGQLDLNSGRDRGRIWRLAPDGRASGTIVRLVNRTASARELVGLLKHPNAWHRDTASRILYEWNAPETYTLIRGLLSERNATLARRHALGMLEAWHRLEPDTLRRATDDSDHVVRRLAFEAIARRLQQSGSPSATEWLELLPRAAVAETNAEVQLAIAFAAGGGRVPLTQRAWVMSTLASSRSSLVRAAAIHSGTDAEFAYWKARLPRDGGAIPETLEQVTQILGRRARSSEIVLALEAVQALQPASVGRQLGAALANGLAQSGHRLNEYSAEAPLTRWFDDALNALPEGSAVLLLAWDVRATTGEKLLSLFAHADEAQARQIFPSLQRHVALGTNVSALRAAWVAADPQRRQQLTDLWLRYPQGARALLGLAAGTGKTIDPTRWTAGQITAMRTHSVPEIRGQARELLGDPPVSRQAVIDQFATALSLPSDSAHGEVLFQERCATCHAFRGEGITLAPDLASVIANGPEKLLVAILDPNREVAPNFASWTAETNDGETVSGLKVRETETSVTLRQAGGAESTWERSRLRSLETTGRSLMPEGLEQGWNVQDLADVLAFLTAESTAKSPALRVSTIAGTGRNGQGSAPVDGAIGTLSELANPFGLVRGPDGALWFCEFDGHRVRRLETNGLLTAIAGTGKAGYSGDGGPALTATFNQPHELRFDAAGHLYIADMRNHAIRRIDRRTRIITTFAGTGRAGYSGDDGAAIAAELRQPHSIQFGPGGDLFICDIGNHVLRRIDVRTGLISTFAGTGKAGPTPDGARIVGTPLNGPRSLDFDARGDLWLATREGNQVFRLELAAGVIHHVGGTGAKGFTGHGGPARLATLSGPKGIAVAKSGDVYLVDSESHSIRRINARTGTLELVVGTGTPGDGPDGDAPHCRLNRPHGIWVDPDGTLYIGDSENHRIRKVSRVE